MNSFLRIRKRKNLEMGKALREADRINNSVEVQLMNIDEGEFEDINLKLIDPCVPKQIRLDILRTSLNEGAKI